MPEQKRELSLGVIGMGVLLVSRGMARVTLLTIALTACGLEATPPGTPAPPIVGSVLSTGDAAESSVPAPTPVPSAPSEPLASDGSWLILTCGLDGCGGDDIGIARASRWNAEAAIVGFSDPEHPSEPAWRHRWFPADVEGIEESARFQTHRECLRALRRAMPVEDRTTTYANTGRGWETTKVEHHRDFVEEFGAVGWVEGSATMMRTYDYACFQKAPRAS